MTNRFEVPVKLTNHSVLYYIKISSKVLKGFVIFTVSNKFLGTPNLMELFERSSLRHSCLLFLDHDLTKSQCYAKL